MSYRIEDEPRPGALAYLVVNPVWPLFAIMFGGSVFSWPWFVLNGLAVGSPSRVREALWAAAGFVGNVVLIVGISVVASADLLGDLGVRYAFVAVTVWKLLVSYSLFVLQGRSFHLYEHFGGRARSGFLVVFLAFFVGQRLFSALPVFWTLVLR